LRRATCALPAAIAIAIATAFAFALDPAAISTTVARAVSRLRARIPLGRREQLQTRACLRRDSDTW